MESNDHDGLSRKEKLAIWRAHKAGAGAGAGAGGKGTSKAVHSSGSKGVLAERAGNSSISAGNGVPAKKRAASHGAAAAVSKAERGRGAQRKPFQVRVIIDGRGSERLTAGLVTRVSTSRLQHPQNTYLPATYCSRIPLRPSPHMLFGRFENNTTS